MATNSTLYVKTGGVWRNPETIWVKSGGVWRAVTKVWVKNGGIWEDVNPVPDTRTFTANGSFVVPAGVNQIYMTAIGGGGSAGNVVDGGRNDDYGGSGGGSGGQKVSNYLIPTNPGETISVVIGAAGSRAYGGRDSANQGGTGGTTYIYTATANYYLLGGTGGYGGVGDAGNQFPGGTTTTSNSSLTVTVDNGQAATGGYGGYGGAGINGNRTPGGRYGGGNSYHNELNAIDYGGGGAGGYSTYIREDNGNSPCWGGLGNSGYAFFSW